MFECLRCLFISSEQILNKTLTSAAARRVILFTFAVKENLSCHLFAEAMKVVSHEKCELENEQQLFQYENEMIAGG